MIFSFSHTVVSVLKMHEAADSIIVLSDFKTFSENYDQRYVEMIGRRNDLNLYAIGYFREWSQLNPNQHKFSRPSESGRGT